VYRRPNGEFYAVKFYHEPKRGVTREEFRNAVEHIVSISHPYVMPIAGVVPPTRAEGPVVVTPYSQCASLADVLAKVRRRKPLPVWTGPARLRMIIGFIAGLYHL
jgi:hypothetical protein